MPTDPQAPGAPAGPSPTSTQEIPVVTPAATGATSVQQLPPPSAPVPPSAPPPGAPHGQRETGPVGVVPGLPGTPPPPAPAGAWPETLEDTSSAPRPVARAPRDRTLLAAAGLVLASLALLQGGLVLEFGTESFWSAVPLWSAFATLCVVLGLAAVAQLVPGARRLAGHGWSIAAAGLVGLAVFWVLVVLPNADSDRGFLLTAALGALGGALWLTAGRRPD